MEHRLWKALKGKRHEDKKRMYPLLMPVKEGVSTGGARDRAMNFHEQSNRHPANGLKTSHSVYESYGSKTPARRCNPQRKKEGRPLRRKNVDIQVPTSLQVGGSAYSKVVQEETIGLGSASPRHMKETKPSDSTNSQSVSREPRIPIPSLPRLPSVHRPRSKSLQSRNDQLATHLSLIDGRRRTHSFRNDSKDSSNAGALGDKLPKSSSNQDVGSSSVLQTELSLPKITIDEVLKSWNVHTSVRIRKRSAGSRSLKHDPMEFLIRQELENSIDLSRQETSPCYDELKSCRYLRMGKEMEEKATHGRCCPCNSCEHGKGLKESPYLNA